MVEGLNHRELHSFVEMVSKANDEQAVQMCYHILANLKDRLVAKEAEAVICK